MCCELIVYKDVTNWKVTSERTAIPGGTEHKYTHISQNRVSSDRAAVTFAHLQDGLAQR